MNRIKPVSVLVFFAALGGSCCNGQQARDVNMHVAIAVTNITEPEMCTCVLNGYGCDEQH